MRRKFRNRPSSNKSDSGPPAVRGPSEAQQHMTLDRDTLAAMEPDRLLSVAREECKKKGIGSLDVLVREDPMLLQVLSEKGVLPKLFAQEAPPTKPEGKPRAARHALPPPAPDLARKKAALKAEAEEVARFIAELEQDADSEHNRFLKGVAKLHELEKKHGGKERIKELQASADAKREAVQQPTPEEELALQLRRLQRVTAQLYRAAELVSDARELQKDAQKILQRQPERTNRRTTAPRSAIQSRITQHSAVQARTTMIPQEKPEPLLKRVATSFLAWAVVGIGIFSAALHLNDKFTEAANRIRSFLETADIHFINPTEKTVTIAWYSILAVVFGITELLHRNAVKKDINNGGKND